MKRKSLKRQSVKRQSVKSTKGDAVKKQQPGKKTLDQGSPTGRVGSGRKASQASIRKEETVPYKPTWLTVNEIKPFALLLRGLERSIVLRSLDYLYQHVRHNPNPKDFDFLYEKTYMEDIKQLCMVDEKHIPASAFRLLGEISQDPYSHKFIVDDKSIMDSLSTKFNASSKDSDAKVAQHAAKVLWEITKDINVVRRLLAEDSVFDMTNLLNNLKSSSHDVVYNNLSIIANIFKDLKTAEMMVNLKDFKFGLFFPLIDNKYLEIQNKTLNLINWLVSQPKTPLLKAMFIHENGIDKMFTVLKKFHWRDIHPVTLEILRAVLEDDEDKNRILGSAGIQKLYDYIEFCEDDNLIAKVLWNIYEISSTVFGKPILVNLGIVPTVVGMFSDGTPEMKLGACKIMNEMLQSIETIKEFTEVAPIPQLIDIIVDPEYSWELIGAALCCTHNLLKVCADLAYALTKPKLRSKIKNWIIKVLPTIPLPYKELLYNTMSVIVQHSIVRAYILEFPLVWAFLLGLRDTRPETAHVQLVSAEALFYIIPTEPYARQFILASGGIDIICRALEQSKDPRVIQTICNVIRVASNAEECLTIAVLRNKILEWLVVRRPHWSRLSAMEWAATALQNNYLPAKYEYRGRLGLLDKTKNGFYIRREFDEPKYLPVPPSEASDIVTLISCNFSRYENKLMERNVQGDDCCKSSLDADIKLDEQCVATYKMEFDDPGDRDSGFDLSDHPVYQTKLKENVLTTPVDKRLMNFLKIAEERLEEMDREVGIREYSRPFDHSWVLSRVKVIVEIILLALSEELSDEEESHVHAPILYLTELKKKLNSSVLPLGELRHGGTLERALFFKVMADRLELPASLWRGASGNSWNEISLMQLGNEFPKRNQGESKVKTIDKPEMPLRLIYPTHIVDLIDTPGHLIPVGTNEAARYTGRPIESILDKVPESTPPKPDVCLQDSIN